MDYAHGRLGCGCARMRAWLCRLGLGGVRGAWAGMRGARSVEVGVRGAAHDGGAALGRGEGLLMVRCGGGMVRCTRRNDRVRPLMKRCRFHACSPYTPKQPSKPPVAASCAHPTPHSPVYSPCPCQLPLSLSGMESLL